MLFDLSCLFKSFIKRYFFIFIYIFSSIVISQNKPIKLVDKVLENLNLEKSQCYSKLIIDKAVSELESIILIPEINKKGEGYITLNCHLAIVDNNGKTLSYFTEKESWFSDAIVLDNIEVFYNPYKLNSTSETIGLLIEYSASSRINPYNSKELSLFIRDGNILKRILKDYSIYSLNGEINGINFDGEFIESKKAIIPEINSQTEFYNLKVIDSTTTYEVKGEEQITLNKVVKNQLLQYKNGEYQKFDDKSNISGTWLWNYKDEHSSEIKLIQISENKYKGNYCSSFFNGSKIDCNESSEDYYLFLTKVTETIFEGTFESNFSNNPGNLRVQYLPLEKKIKITILSEPDGEYYLPNNALFKK